ncbi:MAG: J domain-containing protein [Actinomycetota bacterium]
MGLSRHEAAELLNVSVDASPDAVQAARRSHARLWHPDRQSDPAVAEFASERMARINEAADVLMQPAPSAEPISTSPGPAHGAPTRSGPTPRTRSRPEWTTMSWAEARPIVWRVCVAFAITVTITAPFMPNLLGAYGLALIVGTVTAAALIISADRSSR